jgi:hypothetical protein
MMTGRPTIVTEAIGGSGSKQSAHTRAERAASFRSARTSAAVRPHASRSSLAFRTFSPRALIQHRNC